MFLEYVYLHISIVATLYVSPLQASKYEAFLELRKKPPGF